MHVERREEEVYSGLDLFVRQSSAGIYSNCATFFKSLFFADQIISIVVNEGRSAVEGYFGSVCVNVWQRSVCFA